MNNTHKTRILLVGCGRWGKLILRDLKILDCTVLVLTQSEESKQNAIDGGADQLINGLEESGEIDGAIVAVNSAAHFEVINSILDHFGNIPLYVEKPLCIKASDARHLLERAPANLFVMHKWRYHQGILALSEMAKSNRLGKLLGIKLTRNNWGIPHTDVDCTWILLPHDLSIVLEIAGYLPPARYARFDKTPNGIQGLSGFLSDNRLWVSLEISERSPGNKREMILYFENGLAQLNDSYDEKIEIFQTDPSDLRIKPDPAYKSFANTMPLMEELKAFITWIQGHGDPPKSSVQEGYEVVLKIEELRELASHEE